MTGETSERALTVRDEAGTWYVLTPELLRAARASAAQQAELEERLGGDTTGFSIIVHDLVASPLTLWSSTSPDLTTLKSDRPNF